MRTLSDGRGGGFKGLLQVEVVCLFFKQEKDVKPKHLEFAWSSRRGAGSSRTN